MVRLFSSGKSVPNSNNAASDTTHTPPATTPTPDTTDEAVSSAAANTNNVIFSTSSTPLPMAAESWTCSACTYLNSDVRFPSCSMCGADRSSTPSAAKKPHRHDSMKVAGNTTVGWTCSSCTFNNQVSTDTCEMCSAKRSSPARPKKKVAFVEPGDTVSSSTSNSAPPPPENNIVVKPNAVPASTQPTSTTTSTVSSVVSATANYFENFFTASGPPTPQSSSSHSLPPTNDNASHTPSRSNTSTRSLRRRKELPSHVLDSLHGIFESISAVSGEEHTHIVELLILLSKAELLHESLAEKDKLEEKRMVDDLLEDAIQHRNGMRILQRKACSIDCLQDFMKQFHQITSLPCLRDKRSMHRFGTDTSQSISDRLQEFVSLHFGGWEECLMGLSSIKEATQYVSSLLTECESGVLSSAQSPHEALLLAGLIELSRSGLHLCCYSLNDPAMESADTCSGNSPPTHNRQLSGSDIGVEYSSWERQLKENLHLARKSPEGREFLSELLSTLTVVRYTAHYHLHEDVQASVALLIAELMSLYDRIVPAGQCLPALERRKPSSTLKTPQQWCLLSGMVLAPDEHKYCIAARRLWERNITEGILPA